MATGGWEATASQDGDDARARIAAVVARHEAALVRTARQFSLCHDDALDAYQRALEIFVRRVDTVDPATEVAWLKVVVRHEAMAIRRARSDSVTPEEMDLDTFMPAPERSVEERIASGERVRRSAEALSALRPDEARALLLKAHGLSYEEIGERSGWSYTKVNRALTEGRRRFLDRYAAIEAGEECDRFAPIVEALAAGHATSAQLLTIRPHLRHCTACRATVRDLHLGRHEQLVLFGAAAEPALETVLELPPVPEPSEATRIVAEPPSDPAPAESIVVGPPPRPAPAESIAASPPDPAPFSLVERAKHELLAFFHRLGGPDLATSVHIASAGSGGRAATLAAIIGFCLSGATAGTVCVMTGVLPNPLERQEPKDSRESRADDRPRRKPPRADQPPTPPPTTLSADLAAVRPTPTPAPTPRPARPPRREPKQAPRVTTGASVMRQQASETPSPLPTSPPPDPVSQEFGIEEDAVGPAVEAIASSRSGGQPSTPPAAPATPAQQPTTNPATQEFDPVGEEFGP